jgi:hypothetical protein
VMSLAFALLITWSEYYKMSIIAYSWRRPRASEVI